ncbi:MAG: OprD family outer membrane porin [Campylobacteraceae bacterium]|jgi:hypothetical protein|nr:OprD family outer membrane porin [Campylobacteraceae bacterium]
MKTTISALTLIAFSSSVNAADSLIDVFRDGNMTGELRSYYFNQKIGGKKADILDLAIRLNYKTDFYYGFQGGATFQSSNSPFADKDAKDMFSAPNSMYGPGAVLSEAYISYALNKSALKIGRQFINMPLIKGGMGKAVIQSFEGITFISNEIPNNTFYAAYINKFQKQTNGKGDAPKFEKLDGNYVYAFSVINNYFEKLSLTGAYGGMKDIFSILYMQADFKDVFSYFNYQIATQYSHTDYKNSAFDNSNYYGVKIGAGFENFNMYIALAQIKDGDSKFGAVGGGNKCVLFTSSYEQCAEYEKSKQYAIDANYNFKRLKLLTGVRYAHINYEEINDKTDFKNIYATHYFSGALDGLSIGFLYENENHKNAKDTNLYIARVAYKF